MTAPPKSSISEPHMYLDPEPVNRRMGEEPPCRPFRRVRVKRHGPLVSTVGTNCKAQWTRSSRINDRDRLYRTIGGMGELGFVRVGDEGDGDDGDAQRRRSRQGFGRGAQARSVRRRR